MRLQSSEEMACLVEEVFNPENEVESNAGDVIEVVLLQFNEDLLWTNGRALSTNVLISRLTDLCNELVGITGELFMLSAADVTEALVHPIILTHEDPGVKALAVHCILEMICITSPNMPFLPLQLQVCA